MGLEDCPEPYVTKISKDKGINEISVFFRKKTGITRFTNLAKYRKAQNIGHNLISDPIDAVHIQVPIRPAMLARRLLSKEKIPYIVTEHWSGHLNGQFENKSFIYKYFYKKIINGASEVTVVSQSLKKQIDKRFNKNVRVVPNYICSVSVPVQKKEHSTTQVITVCDFNNKTKNIIGLLQAFRSVIMFDKPVHLTIIGSGPDQSLIEDYIKKNELTNHVTLLGRLEQKEVHELLPSFHFYICNSNVETFGMTVAEAILSGLPVICTKCGGPEQFVNHQNGILIPVNDSIALKNAMQEMILNYRNFNSESNQNAIKTQFGQTAIVNKWKAIYESTVYE